uniref:Uncharacterized protein n=1 Tax=Drosophila-associated filamentous virus TaxID=2743186 RepID=A0A6M9U0W5_9VIRU|nr:putative protein 28 [Drosophila-associated filamentous virus]
MAPIFVGERFSSVLLNRLYTDVAIGKNCMRFLIIRKRAATASSTLNVTLLVRIKLLDNFKFTQSEALISRDAIVARLMRVFRRVPHTFLDISSKINNVLKAPGTTILSRSFLGEFANSVELKDMA